MGAQASWAGKHSTSYALFQIRDDNFTNPWEWNPYESGSWATNISAFVPTEFVGTTYNNGTPASKLECVTHFDNYGFAVGTSSAVFNVASEFHK